MIIFYDGYCPLCAIEMRQLRQRDSKGAIQFEDIQSKDFTERYPHLNWQALNERIHVQLSNGRMVTGLDATHAVWSAVGKGWLYAPLRWPVIRWFADKAYNLFARNRYRISYVLTGKSRLDHCERCIK